MFKRGHVSPLPLLVSTYALPKDLVGRPFSTSKMERRTFFRPVVDFTTGARAGSLTYHPRSDEKQSHIVTPKLQIMLRATFGSR